MSFTSTALPRRSTSNFRLSAKSGEPDGAPPHLFPPAERTGLHGDVRYAASRMDSFLGASLVFARDTQIYLLALCYQDFAGDIHTRADDAFAIYAAGIEQALKPDRAFLVGDKLSVADICFVSELCLFSNEHLRRSTLAKRGLTPILSDTWPQEFPGASAHFGRLIGHPAFAPDVGPYLQKLERNRHG